jgi:hypothetical protein
MSTSEEVWNFLEWSAWRGFKEKWIPSLRRKYIDAREELDQKDMVIN